MPSQSRIYLDNAATSWPKPPAVYEAVDSYQRVNGAPLGRGTYGEAQSVERTVAEARRGLARLLGVRDPNQVILAFNGTDALNIAIHGYVRRGDHVVTTVVEHNSVLRPLRHLADTAEVEITHVECDAEGIVAADAIGAAIRPETRLVVLSHASNVTGALQPVEEVARLLRARQGPKLLVDAAQSAGHVPIDVDRWGVDMLATSGHKGLLGPLGTGLLCIRRGLEGEISSFRQGGTGSQGDEDRQPRSMPDKYEPGNQNVPGLVGLAASVSYLNDHGIDEVRQHAERLTTQLLGGLQAIAGVTIYGPREVVRRVSVVSLSVEGYDPQELATTLDAAFGIQTRAGFHCAPHMHAALGTAERGGTLRLSVGLFNTQADVAAAIAAVRAIAAARVTP
jgi:cysteine desulfurase / selenocysteine lyase